MEGLDGQDLRLLLGWARLGFSAVGTNPFVEPSFEYCQAHVCPPKAEA